MKANKKKIEFREVFHVCSFLVSVFILIFAVSCDLSWNIFSFLSSTTTTSSTTTSSTTTSSTSTTTTVVASLPIIMVQVPGGSFTMGSESGENNESPAHAVTVSSFQIGKYEVTQAQYSAVMEYNASLFRDEPDSSARPVERVTWFDAVEFCNKLSALRGYQQVYIIENRSPSTGYPITSANVSMNMAKNGYRLPTEAEWEYAAKGGNGSPGGYVYAGSNNVGNVAWYSMTSESSTHTIGQKNPNGLGIYDMSGNVWEWCWDWYDTYGSSASTDPTGPGTGHYRIQRGGAYYYSATYMRSVFRYCEDIPGARNGGLGFRVARRP